MRLVDKFKTFIKSIFPYSTRNAVKFDIARFKTRLKNRKTHILPLHDKLHLGCGGRKISGWLNVDVVGSDYDVDLASGKLPWKNSCFSAIASQHVVEHLWLEEELIPLVKELARVIKPDGELWISTPDLEKICKAYVQDKARSLIEDKLTRYPDFAVKPTGIPTQHFVNFLFHQGGEHKNLFDYELLKWILNECGFHFCKIVTESDFLKRFPEFPVRNDDAQSIYVLARLAE